MHLKSSLHTLTMILLLLLCQLVCHSHSLPVNLNPSQIDSLIDPIHQSDYEDLESRKVVVKSVFNTPVFTPAPTRCPSGHQRLANGSCVKKFVVTGGGFDFDPKLLASLTKEFYRKNPVRHGHRTTQRHSTQELVPTTTESVSTTTTTVETTTLPYQQQPIVIPPSEQLQTNVKEETGETMTEKSSPEQQEQQIQFDTTTATITTTRETTTIPTTTTVGGSEDEETTFSHQRIVEDEKPILKEILIQESSSWPSPTQASFSSTPTPQSIVQNDTTSLNEENIPTTMSATEAGIVTTTEDESPIVFMSTTPMTMRIEEESTPGSLDLEMKDAESGAETERMTVVPVKHDKLVPTPHIPVEVSIIMTPSPPSTSLAPPLSLSVNLLTTPIPILPSESLIVPQMNQLKVQNTLANHNSTTTLNELSFPPPLVTSTIPPSLPMNSFNKTKSNQTTEMRRQDEETGNAVTSVYLELEEKTIMSPPDQEEEKEVTTEEGQPQREFTTAVYMRQTLEAELPGSNDVKRIPFLSPPDTLLEFVPSSSDIYKPTMPPHHPPQPTVPSQPRQADVMTNQHHHHHRARTFFSFGYLQNYE